MALGIAPGAFFLVSVGIFFCFLAEKNVVIIVIIVILL